MQLQSRRWRDVGLAAGGSSSEGRIDCDAGVGRGSRKPPSLLYIFGGARGSPLGPPTTTSLHVHAWRVSARSACPVVSRWGSSGAVCIVPRESSIFAIELFVCTWTRTHAFGIISACGAVPAPRFSVDSGLECMHLAAPARTQTKNETRIHYRLPCPPQDNRLLANPTLSNTVYNAASTREGVVPPVASAAPSLLELTSKSPHPQAESTARDPSIHLERHGGIVHAARPRGVTLTPPSQGASSALRHR